MTSALRALAWVLVVAVLLATSGSLLQADPPPPPTATVAVVGSMPLPLETVTDTLTPSLRLAIGEAIKLLNAKKYDTLLRRFIPPEQLGNFFADSSFADLVTSFGSGPAGKSKAAMLLKVMRKIQRSKPTYVVDDGQTVATYTYKPAINGRTKISFLHINGIWYIGN